MWNLISSVNVHWPIVAINNLILLAITLCVPLIVSACNPDKRNGVFVAEFANESNLLIFKPNITLPSPEDDYRFNYELRKGATVCTLTGELDIKEAPPDDECPGTKGRGKISCNDGKSMKLRWSLTSCRGGFGKSTSKGNTKLYFGFDRNKERALDQLNKAKQ